MCEANEAAWPGQDLLGGHHDQNAEDTDQGGEAEAAGPPPHGHLLRLRGGIHRRVPRTPPAPHKMPLHHRRGQSPHPSNDNCWIGVPTALVFGNSVFLNCGAKS